MLFANKNLRKVASCINHRTQPRNCNAQKCNSTCNPIATISLKSLATQLLERNRQCNSNATKDKNQCNFIIKKVTEKLRENLCVLPRLIRLMDVPQYLGMDRRIFNKEVRPYLIEILIGVQGKAFDRLDLDKWVDYYKTRSGRPSNKRLILWDVKERQGSTSVENSGMLINKFSASAFAKVLEQIRLKQRKST